MTTPTKNEKPQSPSPQRISTKAWLLLGAGFLALILILFREVLSPDSILFTSDDGIGAISGRKHALPVGFFGWWVDDILLGNGADLFVNWTNLLLWVLPLKVFINWIHVIDLGLASVFLALFLKNRGVSLPAIAAGVLAALWIGNNFTLTYAGHIGKYGVLVFAAAYLWLSDIAVRRKSWAHAILAGGALGMTFLEQGDVALFCAMFLVPYTIVTCWLAYPKNFAVLLKLLVPLCVVTGTVALHSALASYSGNVKNVAAVQQEDAEARWDFATQWSWPPEECVDFIAPGYMGWRSHEASGPYWGRMGRSAGWSPSQPQRGFMNFKLENQYMGVIPVALALWAAFLFFSKRVSSIERKRQLLIWTIIMVATLLLSFGKYFPLYRILFALPGFSAIRNPNKFLHLFQIAFGILAAYGLDDLLRSPKTAKRLAHILLGAGAIFLFWCFGVSAKQPDVVGQMAAQSVGVSAAVISSNMAIAAGHAAVMALLFGGYLLLQSRKFRPQLKWIPVLIIAVDVLLLGRHFISAQDGSSIAANVVTDKLKEGNDGSRVALTSQDSFYNYWLTYLFPYQQIRSFNFTQMPRMPADYQAYLAALGQNPLRLWQVSAVKDIVTPTQFIPQIQRDPKWKDQFTTVMTFSVGQGPNAQQFLVYPGTEQQPGQHAIIQFKNPSPRFYLFSKWREATDEQALARLKDAASLFDETIVEPGAAIAPSAPDTVAAPAGTVTIKNYQPGRALLSIDASKQAMLRFNEHYTPGWKAWIDGKPAKVLRCDFIMQGVLIDPGAHEVEFRYETKPATLWLQFAGMGLCILTAGFISLQNLLRKRGATAGAPAA